MISEKDFNDIFSEGYTKGYVAGNKRAKEKDQEIQRLNNIIDELEKYLIGQMEYYKLETDYYVEYKLILNKLKELKGDNNEESKNNTDNRDNN